MVLVTVIFLFSTLIFLYTPSFLKDPICYLNLLGFAASILFAFSNRLTLSNAFSFEGFINLGLPSYSIGIECFYEPIYIVCEFLLFVIILLRLKLPLG